MDSRLTRAESLIRDSRPNSLHLEELDARADPQGQGEWRFVWAERDEGGWIAIMLDGETRDEEAASAALQAAGIYGAVIREKLPLEVGDELLRDDQP